MCITCNIYNDKYNIPIYIYTLEKINELKRDYTILLHRMIEKKENMYIEKEYCNLLINVINMSNIDLIEENIKILKKDFFNVLNNYTDCKK